MALARVKTWSAGEVLTASDLNAEFNNLLNNALSLISPLTAALDANGLELILDADADTSITADTDDRIDFKIGGSDLYAMSTVGLTLPLTNTITAGSTQTQAGATALTAQVNRVTVSGTDGDGVKLPTAVAGQKILIINDDAAQTIKVWPNTSDAIDGGSADAADSATLGPGLSREYFAVDATNWYTATPHATAAAQRAALGLGTGDDVDFNSLSLQGYKLNLFIFQTQNSGGTIKHQFRTIDLNALPEHVLGINGASATLTNTPTGTDSSTAFAAGAKIGSGDTSAVWLDTADLTAPADAMSLGVISYNDTTVDYVAMPYMASVNINGVTRSRLAFQLKNPTTGAAVAWSTALGVAKTIRIFALAMLPDYA